MAPRTENGKEHVQTEEKMMSAQVRSLIDTCFEEGHYESAIDILEKSRLPGVYPAPYHIRVLLYIALYPPAGLQSLTTSATPSAALFSPRKERTRKTVSPSPTASRRATSFLHALAATISPTNLMRGLPAYSKKYIDGEGWRVDVLPGAPAAEPTSLPDVGPRGEESKLAFEAICFTRSKNIWTCLEDGFVKRLDGLEPDLEDEIYALKSLVRDPHTTPRKPKKNSTRKSKVKNEADEWDGEESTDGTPAVVRTRFSESVWPVLEWFIEIFEKDQSNQKENKQPAYSPLLLSQLPISSPRSDISQPVTIAFAAFGAGPTGSMTFTTGMRLINLLVNLTLPQPPQSLSPSQCLYWINASLVKKSTDPYSDLPLDFMDSFLSRLAILNPAFKICLCCLYLASVSVGGDPRKFLGGNPGGAASVRTGNTPVKPKPSRRGLQSQAQATSKLTPQPGSPPTPFPLPTVEDVLEILRLAPKVELVDEEEEEEEEEDPFAAQPSRSKPEGLPHLRLRLDHATAKAHILAAILTSRPSAWVAPVKDGRLKAAVLKGLQSSIPQRSGSESEVEEDVLKGLQAKHEAMKAVLGLFDATF